MLIPIESKSNNVICFIMCVWRAFCLTYDNLVCNECGFETMYSVNNTWYFKCPRCNNVLIDVDLDEKIIEELTVFDYDKIDALKIF